MGASEVELTKTPALMERERLHKTDEADEEERPAVVERLSSHAVEMMDRLRRRGGKITLKTVFEEEVRIQKSKVIEEEAQKMRNMNFMSAALTGLNLFFFIFSLWYFWDTSTRKYDPASWGMFLRLSSSIVIVGQMFLLTTWHKKVLEQQELTWNLIPGTLSFASNCGLWLSEMCVLVLHYPPWIEDFFDSVGSDHYINEKFALIGFCRLYLLFRLLRDTDPAFTRRNEYERTSECDDAGVLQYNYPFLLRSLLNRHPFASVLASFGVTMFALSFTIWVLQREGNADFNELQDAMWYTIVTMTTVGYGQSTVDINTGTKIFANLAAVVGILWWGVIIALVRWKLQLTRRQHHSLVWSKQEMVSDAVQNDAASLIQCFWRFYSEEKLACGIPVLEKWAQKQYLDGFGKSPRGSSVKGTDTMEKIELRMESFQQRLRERISLDIYQLRCSVLLKLQVEAEGRGDPMKQVFTAIEDLRESMVERREMFSLRMDQHVKLMRRQTKDLCEHLRDQHFRRTNGYRHDINEAYRSILHQLNDFQVKDSGGGRANVRRKPSNFV